MRFTYSTALKPVVALLLALTAFSLPAGATQVSQFCPECTDASVARQKATAFAPPVRCDWPNGRPEFPIPEELICYSIDLDLLLVNPLSGDLYAYRLLFDPQINSHIVQTRALTFDEEEAARTTVEIYQALLLANFGGMASAQTGLLSDTPNIQNSLECPDGTALDHVLNPELRQWMIDELRNQWFTVLSRFNNRNAEVTRTFGISASVGGVSLSVGWSRSQPPVDDIFVAGFGFDVSEVVRELTQNGDVITFVINDARWVDGRFVMDKDFSPELSRAAGVAVNDLLSGQAVVDNSCVMEKLARHAESIGAEFRIGGAGGDPFDLGSVNPNQGGSLCTRHLCASVCVDGDCQCQFEVVVLVPCD